MYLVPYVRSRSFCLVLIICWLMIGLGPSLLSETHGVVDRAPEPQAIQLLGSVPVIREPLWSSGAKIGSLRSSKIQSLSALL